MIASVYIPFFFIEDYGLNLQLDMDTSFYMLSVMNAASLFGRLAPNWLADKSAKPSLQELKISWQTLTMGNYC